jgi:hypothetical protein
MPDAQMAGSPAGKTLVSYDHIVKPFPDTQTLLRTARQAAGQVIADPNGADARVAQLASALNELQASQRNNSRVMNTPRNAMGAQLQTHLARQAKQENKLEAKRIFAWYWGHEHRCVLYDPHPGWGLHGRCVGHGGFPENRVDLSNAPFSAELGSQWRQIAGRGTIPGAIALDTANLYIPTFETQFSPHGFMRLEFNNNDVTEYVRAPDNSNIYLKPLA